MKLSVEEKTAVRLDGSGTYSIGERVWVGQIQSSQELLDQTFYLERDRTGAICIQADTITWGCNSQPRPFLQPDGHTVTDRIPLTEAIAQYPDAPEGFLPPRDGRPYRWYRDRYERDVKSLVDKAAAAARELGWLAA